MMPPSAPLVSCLGSCTKKSDTDFNQNLNALDIRFEAKEKKFNQKFKSDVCNCNVWKVQKPGILIKLAITHLQIFQS